MPPTKQKTPIDAGRFLADQGIKVIGVDPESEDLLSEFPDKSTGPLKKEQVIADLQLPNTEDFAVEWNSPEKAVAESPVSLVDRLKLTTTKEARSLPFLKARFEDAMVDPKQGVLVKHKGVWHQVDPSGLGSGDAWAKTKELAKDVVDTADEIAAAFSEGVSAFGTGATAAAVTAPLLGPGAAVPGYLASIAGAAAGSKSFNRARFRLGRMLGTYDATEKEQEQDEALEMLYAAGGQAAAPGVAMGLKGIAKGVKNLASWGGRLFVNLNAKLLGTEADNLYRVADRPQQVETAIKAAWGEAKAHAGKRVSADKAVEAALQRQVGTVKTMLEEASSELPKRYTQILQETADEAAKSGTPFYAEISDAARNILEGLSAGETKFFEKVAAQSADGTPKVAFRLLPDEQILSEAGQSVFDRKSFSRLARQLQGLADSEKVAVGSDAVKQIAAIKKELNAVLRYPAKGAPADELSKIAKIGEVIDNNLDGLFGESGSPLRQLWDSKAAPYKRYADSVNWGRRILSDNTERALETFAKQATSSKATKGAAAKKALGTAADQTDNAAGSIMERLGERGTQLADTLADLEAAKALIPTAPRLGLAQLTVINAIGSAKLGPVVGSAAAAGFALQSTPAVVRKQISHTARAVATYTDLIKGIAKARGESGLAQAFTNRKFVDQLMTQMARDIQLENNQDAFAKQILDWKMQQSGGGQQ